jgi:hypothetical protein
MTTWRRGKLVQNAHGDLEAVLARVPERLLECQPGLVTVEPRGHVLLFSGREQRRDGVECPHD